MLRGDAASWETPFLDAELLSQDFPVQMSDTSLIDSNEILSIIVRPSPGTERQMRKERERMIHSFHLRISKDALEGLFFRPKSNISHFSCFGTFGNLYIT